MNALEIDLCVGCHRPGDGGQRGRIAEGDVTVADDDEDPNRQGFAECPTEFSGHAEPEASVRLSSRFVNCSLSPSLHW